MTNLLMRATNRPAPIGSIMVGIIKVTENYCGDGSVVTGVASFQGWVRDFCISHIIPPVGGVGGKGDAFTVGVHEEASGTSGAGILSTFDKNPSPSAPLKPAYKSAMLP